MNAQLSANDLLRQDVSSRLDALEQDVTNRLDSLEQNVSDTLSSRFDGVRKEIRRARRQFYWMYAINTALLITVLVKTYFP